ncbi:MAG: fused MFS/spermidine synthase [Verrucomicrobiota bacterium]|nr:fused MFS/spermidine synthase [Verrucomicrobiota bacterium]
MTVLLLFFCSGATALVYEVLWSKYLALMFGSTIQAQTVILAVFMGGLAVGNRLFGKVADKLRDPLAVYGYLEGIIGLYGFFFAKIHSVADFLFVWAGSSIVENGSLLLGLKMVISILLLAIPTILMGGTLPLIAAWLKRRDAEASRVSARFYAVNSLGAVTGAALAGFVMVTSFGMVASLQLTGMLNVLIALAAIVIARRSVFDLRAPTPAPVSPPERASGVATLPVMNLSLLVALTGGISMGMEVLASRTIGLIVGGSLQAFALVLISFILGIGLGSIFVSTKMASWIAPVRLIFGFLFGAAALLMIFIDNIEQWVIFYSQTRFALASNSSGYVLHQLLIIFLSIIILGIPAALLGSVLPLSIRVAGNDSEKLGDLVGKLLTWNTLGAVVGVLVTGFILMPVFGIRSAIAILALMMCGSALFLALRSQFQKGAIAAGILAGILCYLLVGSGSQKWKQIVGSGIFRLRSAPLSSDMIRDRGQRVKLLFYRDAADATVSVETGTAESYGDQRVLRINGKADASTQGDLSTQYLLGHLPFFARPDSKEVFILGFGSGITAGAVLGHPIDRVTIAENCRPVLEAARFFERWNRGVLTNSRTRIFREDARTILKLSPDKYDIIISEPSNPWVAGIGSVFSKEFYEIASNRLKDGGVMAQWFHIYEMHDGIVSLVIRTFSSVFPHVEIWDTEDGDIVLLGSHKPWETGPAQYQKVYERNRPRLDLEEIGLKTPLSVWARQIASQNTAYAIPGNGPIQTDEFPVLEYSAPEAFFIGRPAEELFRYDERIRQSFLADPKKSTVLRALPEAVFSGIFQEFTTSNMELLNYYAWRVARMGGGEEHPVYGTSPLLPIIFRPPVSYPEQVTLPPTASSNRVAVAKHELNLLRNPQDWDKSIAGIEQQIATINTNVDGILDWDVAYYSTLATKVPIAHKQYDRAFRNLVKGRSFFPANPELLYLERVLQRHLPEPPKEVSEKNSGENNLAEARN